MAVSQRCAPQLYKDSLTPALHRRFTKAASIALLLCYIESVLIGDKSSRTLQSRNRGVQELRHAFETRGKRLIFTEQ